MLDAAALVIAVAAGSGAAAGVRALGRRERLHRLLVRPVRAAPKAITPLAFGPACAAAPLGVLAFARPWGPLSDTAAASLAALALCLAVVGSGQAVTWWRRRRLRELYPDWLAFLSLALAFGIPLAAAADVAAAGLEAPLGPVAARLAAGLKGPEPSQALERFAQALGTPEAVFAASLLGRQRHLGVSVASILVEEEGLLSRARWQERHSRHGIVPYAFTASVGVLLVNAAVLFLVPRAAALVATFRIGGV